MEVLILCVCLVIFFFWKKKVKNIYTGKYGNLKDCSNLPALTFSLNAQYKPALWYGGHYFAIMKKTEKKVSFQILIIQDAIFN